MYLEYLDLESEKLNGFQGFIGYLVLENQYQPGYGLLAKYLCCNTPDCVDFNLTSTKKDNLHLQKNKNKITKLVELDPLKKNFR